MAWDICLYRDAEATHQGNRVGGWSVDDHGPLKADESAEESANHECAVGDQKLIVREGYLIAESYQTYTKTEDEAEDGRDKEENSHDACLD